MALWSIYSNWSVRQSNTENILVAAMLCNNAFEAITAAYPKMQPIQAFPVNEPASNAYPPFHSIHIRRA